MKGSEATTNILRNARIVLPERIAEDASLLIQDDRIAGLFESPTDKPPDTDSEIDLKGLTLFPGFIDVHIHGAVGVDTMQATAKDLARVSQFLNSQGVTGWLPTLVPAPDEDYRRAIDAIQGAMRFDSGARVLGVHYEGPFVSSHQCGALRSEFFRTFSDPAELENLPVVQSPVARHMMTIAPEIDGGVDLVRRLKGRGWIISIGHTRADYDYLDRAFEAGAHHMTHFMNAMVPLHHRSPGPVGWGLARDEVTCDIIADGIHLDPRVLRLVTKIKGPGKLLLISDAIAAAGSGDGKYEIWGETISVKNGRTSNHQGSIAGSVISMLDAVRMMRSLGTSEVDVARMASTNVARLLGNGDECGSIEEGKRADLVALDSEGKVHFTFIGGRKVFSRG